jgi:hypothetical protein
MPSSKRWGKVIITNMPVPNGKITTTKIMQGLEQSPEPVPDEEKEIVKE